MIKFLLISILISSFFGGCSQMEQVVNTASTQNADSSIEQTVLNHVKQNFSLSANEVTIKKVSAENLPAGVSQYYVEKKSSYGNIFYNYLIQNGQLYSSGIDGDFGRFLKDNNFLNGKSLSDEQFLAAFRALKFKARDQNILSVENVANPGDKLKPFVNQLAAPKLTTENGGATFVFFTRNITGSEIRRWETRISADYEVKIESKILEKSA